MTNKERWQEYTAGLSSPQNYVDWGWRYCIAASLQRRVWCPPEHRRCYANMYVIPVGKPGVGKGQIIKSVEEILRYHKLEDSPPKTIGQNDQERAIEAATLAQDLKAAQEEESNTHKNSVEKPLLIPMAANATTYEALVQSMARCLRRINYVEYDDKLQKDRLKIYSHSSMCFNLEELSSLFRKNTNDLVNFLLQCYDCSESYEYSTKNQGKDRIRKVCLNLFGGTTPDFMQRTFDDGLLNQGFSSRAFFIFASKNRRTVFFIPELSTEQKQYRDEVIQHVKGLTNLYGQIRIDKETEAFLQTWLEKFENDPSVRPSKSTKMEAFFSRMNIHVMKVAMANHFGESYEMFISKQEFEQAIDDLYVEAKTMHLALSMEGGNPLAGPAKSILHYLEMSGRKTFTELHVEFFGKLRKTEMEETLSYLRDTDQLVSKQDTDPDTKETLMYYSIKNGH